MILVTGGTGFIGSHLCELLVEEGDCVYFDASVPHFGAAVGSKEVKCLMVIYSET